MATKRITDAAVEPVTLQETKDHLRVTASDEDALISELIVSARQQAEIYLQRSLLTQAWALYLNYFPELMELPFSPVQSVTSIKYIDTAGVEQTVNAADYIVHSQNEPGLIEQAYGKVWPATRVQLNAVTVEYVTGWAQPKSVPGQIKSGIFLIIGDMYRNREDVSPEQNYKLPNSANDLLRPYRLISF